jgi:hemerythrin
MPLIIWSNMLSVGVSEIDRQHQVLIELINRVADLSAHTVSEVDQQAVLDAMTDYAQLHFKFEADLMQQIQYAESKSHLYEHEDFVSKVQVMIQSFKNGQGPQVQDFLVFLRNWLVAHILNTDRNLAKALNAKGIR